MAAGLIHPFSIRRSFCLNFQISSWARLQVCKTYRYNVVSFIRLRISFKRSGNGFQFSSSPHRRLAKALRLR